ncbi:hypothetical protein ILUMI_16430 [Ignelater luminosus]|uniref:Origin recognition complex subunit 4 n=1 Tax=Ignelater luminosus TaxID=2038154 RepID=A0A8K0CSB8_IGNLU|nr:hypothetical protein ILUMI_16430 [Ignelater luminosus]
MVGYKNYENTRLHIKNKIVNVDQYNGHTHERKQLLDILKRTTDSGESNSALLIGPPGVGKTTLVNSILKELQEDKKFNSSAVLVRLHGLIHTDDRLALKAITSRMNLDNAINGKVFGSFAENLSFLLACLQTGQRETSKSVLFILEEFDLFCSHHNQTLLYNLFDVSQSAQTPICVIGITHRLDVIELFEKRVKSRFSHRQIFLFSTHGDDIAIPSINQRIDRISNFLLLTNNNDFSSTYFAQWNKNIKQLMKDKKFICSMQRLLDISENEEITKNIMMLAVSKLNVEKPKISADDIEDELNIFEKDDLVQTVQDLSVLELCLLIAMKHHSEIYDLQPFNFEMILTRYNKFINANSNVQNVQRSVVLKAFEHIQNVELIAPTGTVMSRLQKEYQLFKLLITSQQITEAIKTMNGLPTEVIQWAGSSLA